MTKPAGGAQHARSGQGNGAQNTRSPQGGRSAQNARNAQGGRSAQNARNAQGGRSAQNARNAQEGRSPQRAQRRAHRPEAVQRDEQAQSDRRAQGARTPRDMAAAALLEILEKGAFSHLVLQRALAQAPDMDARDRALVTRLCEGSIEYLLQLDALLERHASVPVPKMKPFIRTVLRMSSYALLYMDKIPASATINEAVKLVKQHGFQPLAGFVNAVLRNVSRDREHFLAELETAAPTLRYSMPEWLYARLSRDCGEQEAERICRYFLEGGKGSYVRHADGSAEYIESGHIAGTEAFLQGEITVQDYASQQVGRLAAPKPGDYIVDVCAAPGGKCCHLASLLEGSGFVDARDLSSQKVALIESNIHRLRLHNISAKVWDARREDPALLIQQALRLPDGSRRLVSRGKADIVICDLPCSGLGIIGRKPDIKYSLRETQIEELQALQRSILAVAQAYVKPGGKLLYSTCTLSREENEDNAAWIAGTLPFTLISQQRFLPGEPSDGFFIAQFQRRKN